MNGLKAIDTDTLQSIEYVIDGVWGSGKLLFINDGVGLFKYTVIDKNGSIKDVIDVRLPVIDEDEYIVAARTMIGMTVDGILRDTDVMPILRTEYPVSSGKYSNDHDFVTDIVMNGATIEEHGLRVRLGVERGMSIDMQMGSVKQLLGDV